MLCHFFFDHFADKLRKKCTKYSQLERHIVELL